MTDRNVYRRNVRVGATPNPVIDQPDSVDEAFVSAAETVLETCTELLRRSIPSHQAAIAIIVAGDWSTIRKYFSLSAKYQAWQDYAVPALGRGLHEWLRHQPGVVRLTQEEVERHPAFAGFSGQTAHPPMRGWLATTIRDRNDVVWGIIQLSDRADGADYDADDADTLELFAAVVAQSLGALWDLRNARKRGT